MAIRRTPVLLVERRKQVLDGRAAEISASGFLGNNTARYCAVAEESRTKLLSGNAQADGLLGLADYGIAFQAIESETGQVEHVPSRDLTVICLAVGDLVNDPATVVSIRGYAVRSDDPQRDWFAHAVALDFGITITPGQSVGNEGFLEPKWRRFRVRPTSKQAVDRVVGNRLAHFSVALVHAPGQSSDAFRNNPNAGPKRAVGRGLVFVDTNTSHRRPK